MQRGSHPSRAADPEGWPRSVMRVLEVLMGAGLRPMVYRVSLVDAETHIMNPTETRHGSGWGWQECAAALCHAGCCVLAVRVHGVSPVSAKLGGARLLPAAHTRAPDLIHACVPPCP